MKTAYKVVPDTNVIIAAEKHPSSTSPNKEFVERWQQDEFVLLYSDDTLLEYIHKLRTQGVAESSIKKLIRAILALGQEVQIQFYHLPQYSVDPDDIAFLLCADNGQATHIISYDKHLKDMDRWYPFKVCGTLEFLRELRKALQNK